MTLYFVGSAVSHDTHRASSLTFYDYLVNCTFKVVTGLGFRIVPSDRFICEKSRNFVSSILKKNSIEIRLIFQSVDFTYRFMNLQFSNKYDFK